MQTKTSFLLSDRVGSLKASQIREVAELGFGTENLIPLWFGESCWPSPDVAVTAGMKAIESGDHFYHANSGKPKLRAAIAKYMQALHGNSFEASNVTVTASGSQGLNLVAQVLVSKGDRVVSLGPTWPNVKQIFEMCGADVIDDRVHSHQGKWCLDIEHFLSQLTRDTKAVIINSPNNPTGWTMSRVEQELVLAHCRKLGIWIIADDVYSRLHRHSNAAPSFLDLIEQDDRVISINSFSKSWSMTGWRFGWITAPVELERPLAMLNEFSIVGPAGFIQEAGLAAITGGEPHILNLNTILQTGYSLVSEVLKMPIIEFIEPDGAFYCLFKVKGMNDSLRTAKKLLLFTGVGTALGIAFGPSCEGH